MFKKELSEWSMLPAEVEVTHFYGTIQHGQGEKHRLRFFSPFTPPAKVEQLIAWPRREKMKTQGEKIKTQGKKYHIFSPS